MRFSQLYDLIMPSWCLRVVKSVPTKPMMKRMSVPLVAWKGKVPECQTQSFLKSYTQQLPFLTQSGQGVSMVQHSVCNAELSCAHGGKDDCERQMTSESYKSHAADQRGSASISVLFQFYVYRQRAFLSQDTMELPLVLESKPEQRKWTSEEISTLKSAYALSQKKYK